MQTNATMTADMAMALSHLSAFWGAFSRSPLYETGFGDAVQDGGASKAETVEEALVGMAYVLGYANACRIACPYMGREWQIANLAGLAAGMFVTALREGDDAERVKLAASARIKRLCDQYTRELAELAAKGRVTPLAVNASDEVLSTYARGVCR